MSPPTYWKILRDSTTCIPNPWEFSWDHFTQFQNLMAIQSSTKQNNPITTWLSRNGKARLKPLPHLEKPITMTRREPNTQIHVPCVQKSTRKSHMRPITCNYSHRSFLIQHSLFFLCFPYPSFDFLCFLSPMLDCSKNSLSVK